MGEFDRPTGVRFVAFDQSFHLLTLPSTRKGTAKVVRGHGIKVNGIYYSGDTIRQAKMAGKDLDVRYDPMDVSVAYVYADGRWCELQSEYAAEFKHHSLKEIEILSQEIYARFKDSGDRQKINARLLAETLLKPDTESASYRQRIQDQESRQALEGAVAFEIPSFQRAVNPSIRSSAPAQMSKRGPVKPRKDVMRDMLKDLDTENHGVMS